MKSDNKKNTTQTNTKHKTHEIDAYLASMFSMKPTRRLSTRASIQRRRPRVISASRRQPPSAFTSRRRAASTSVLTERVSLPRAFDEPPLHTHKTNKKTSKQNLKKLCFQVEIRLVKVDEKKD
jgi:hypothetical protein